MTRKSTVASLTLLATIACMSTASAQDKPVKVGILNDQAFPSANSLVIVPVHFGFGSPITLLSVHPSAGIKWPLGRLSLVFPGLKQPTHSLGAIRKDDCNQKCLEPVTLLALKKMPF